MEKYCKLCKEYGHSHLDHKKGGHLLTGGHLANGVKVDKNLLGI